MTVIHELLKNCADTGLMIKLEPTQSTVLTIQDVANTLWSSGLIATYAAAHNAAVDLTNEVGFELTSPRGKFWKRAKGVIQTVLSEYSAETACFTETDWASTFDTLRKMFGDLTGSTENITTYRTYWFCPVDIAMILGPKFSLHSSSCYWSSYADSFKQLVGSKGYMLRGVWGDNQVKDDTTVDYRIGSRIVTVPQFTDYQKPDTEWSAAVRTWVIPLKNDTIAIFNGYKATITANPNTRQVWDFSPATRDKYRNTSGEVVRFISTDLATHFMANGVQRAVVRSVPKKHGNDNDVNAFVNMDAFSIVGSDDGDFMTNGYKNGLNIPEQAYKMSTNWEQSITPKDTIDEILDVRHADQEDDDDQRHDNIIEHMFNHHGMTVDERNGIDWGEFDCDNEGYLQALENYRERVDEETTYLDQRTNSMEFLVEHEAMTTVEQMAVEVRISNYDLMDSYAVSHLIEHLFVVRSEPMPSPASLFNDRPMYVRRGENVIRLYENAAMTGHEAEILGNRLRGKAIEISYAYIDLLAMLVGIRAEVDAGWHPIPLGWVPAAPVTDEVTIDGMPVFSTQSNNLYGEHNDV